MKSKLCWFIPIAITILFTCLLISSFSQLAQGYEDSLIRAGVPKDKIDDCMIWALGEDYPSLPLREIDTVWNERHGNIFVIHGYDLADEAFYKIGEAYLEDVTGVESEKD